MASRRSRPSLRASGTGTPRPMRPHRSPARACGRSRAAARGKPSVKPSWKCSIACSGIAPRPLAFSRSATRRCSTRSPSTSCRRRRRDGSRPLDLSPQLCTRLCSALHTYARCVRLPGVSHTLVDRFPLTSPCRPVWHECCLVYVSVSLLKADLHLHTREAEPWIAYNARALIARAARDGYQVLSVTNHDTLTFDERLADYARRSSKVRVSWFV